MWFEPMPHGMREISEDDVLAAAEKIKASRSGVQEVVTEWDTPRYSLARCLPIFTPLAPILTPSTPVEGTYMPTVTVVPADNLIIVDGKALVFPFDAPANMHALQWREEQGHTEWTDGPNKPLTTEDYDDQVAPFITRWQNEKARLEQVAAEAEAARLAEYNSEEARFERLRSERDRRLAATDYLLMPDYPLDDTLKGAVQAYRQALRDLPSQEGAPWDGGGEATPWPELPACATYSRT